MESFQTEQYQAGRDPLTSGRGRRLALTLPVSLSLLYLPTSLSPVLCIAGESPVLVLITAVLSLPSGGGKERHDSDVSVHLSENTCDNNNTA